MHQGGVSICYVVQRQSCYSTCKDRRFLKAHLGNIVLGGLWFLWLWLQLKMWVLGLFVKVLQRFSLEVHWWCRMTARIKVLPGCLAPTCCSRSLSGSATAGQLSWVRRPCAEGFNPIVDPSLPAKREISSCAYLISNTKYKIQNMEEQVGWLYISCTTK